MRLLSIAALAFVRAASAADVYFNDFNGPPGTVYPEWSCRSQAVTNVESPNGKQRFLGEFGGAAVVTGPPFVRVDQTVRLTLNKLPGHSLVTVSFDLYVLKSWDGNNRNYGPDRWSLSVEGGPALLDTTFSNNRKTGANDLSLQNYPAPDSPPQTLAFSLNTLGYRFYGDSIYRLTFTFPHKGGAVTLYFASSLYEGKGTEDESWGLDNVRVATG